MWRPGAPAPPSITSAAPSAAPAQPSVGRRADAPREAVTNLSSKVSSMRFMTKAAASGSSAARVPAPRLPAPSDRARVAAMALLSSAVGGGGGGGVGSAAGSVAVAVLTGSSAPAAGLKRKRLVCTVDDESTLAADGDTVLAAGARRSFKAFNRNIETLAALAEGGSGPRGVDVTEEEMRGILGRRGGGEGRPGGGSGGAKAPPKAGGRPLLNAKR